MCVCVCCGRICAISPPRTIGISDHHLSAIAPSKRVREQRQGRVCESAGWSGIRVIIVVVVVVAAAAVVVVAVVVVVFVNIRVEYTCCWMRMRVRMRLPRSGTNSACFHVRTRGQKGPTLGQRLVVGRVHKGGDSGDWGGGSGGGGHGAGASCPRHGHGWTKRNVIKTAAMHTLQHEGICWVAHGFGG